ncbi:biliverdin-producing heme oxygenase [Enterovirga aerilata]|uniref:Biliverdin-producing heme oxygenase n=1 Tax=Enterovirga aerilata TaxID=2730920 RepID=A0A849I9W7_9HYPH|nr:biliverdin-producing heme oxygenase [Enterovirga sp. DB1703]NNM73065.1 biliverdin-producing heme oxygenase [Enterovirga sp. DB1703]
MRDDIVARLRDATGEAHQRLETRLDIIRRVSSPGGRRALVERFYGLHEGAERSLAPLLDPVADLAFPKRRRAPTILDDLAALGRDDFKPLPVCSVEPPGSSAEAMGFFYVLEGSTLGGKMIRRELEARGLPGTGLAFLDPYGAETGERWRAFLAVLRRECPDGHGQAGNEMVAGSVRAFRQAESWLCPTEAA